MPLTGYRQRADDAEDEALKGVLLHNMGEEVEHAPDAAGMDPPPRR
jgi:hypothetical protein